MAGGSDSGEGGTISGINVTPLVDVMLVLLVIFMVTAPILNEGIDVQLPRADGRALPADGEAEALIVSIDRDGAIFVGEDRVPLPDLAARVRIAIEENPGRVVYVRGDDQTNYGVVASVMGALRAGGVHRLGLVTQPAMPPQPAT